MVMLKAPDVKGHVLCCVVYTGLHVQVFKQRIIGQELSKANGLTCQLLHCPCVCVCVCVCGCMYVCMLHTHTHTHRGCVEAGKSAHVP